MEKQDVPNYMCIWYASMERFQAFSILLWTQMVPPEVSFDPRGVRGHAPPENFEVLDSNRCIFMYFHVFFGYFVSFFFAPKSTNLNKFEVNYVAMK